MKSKSREEQLNEAQQKAKSHVDAARSQQEAMAIRQTEFKRALLVVANAPEGKTVLRELQIMCAYHQSSTCANNATGMIDTHATLYNEGRRNIWTQLRRFLPSQVLAELEYPTEN